MSVINIHRRIISTPLTSESPCIRYFSPSKKNSIKNQSRFQKRNLCVGSAEPFMHREKRKCRRFFQISPRTPLYKRCKKIKRRLEFDDSFDSIENCENTKTGNFIHSNNENVIPSVVISSTEYKHICPRLKFEPKFIQITIPNHVDLATPNTEKLISTISPYQKCKLLGRGRFGTVVQNVYKGKNVAVKIIHNSNRNLKRSLHNEQNGIGLKHPNIVNVIKIVYPHTHSNSHHSIIIMECFNVADNLQILLDNDRYEITPHKIVKFSSDICRGLQYLHSNNILHLDIKPKNILTFPSNLCKLCDFGTSLKLGENIQKNDILYQFKGTIQYCSPELLRGHCPTPASDIYSFGITMWQMRYRTMPYDYSIREESLIYQIVTKGLRPCISMPSPAYLDQLYIKIFVNCWSHSPHKRLHIEHILYRLRCIGSILRPL